MKRTRFAALFLTVALLLSSIPALAYNAGSLLPQKRRYTAPFTDTKGSWCDSYVQTVYEVGLMEGKSAGRFDPKGTLSCAQIMAVTARLHALLNGKDGTFPAAGAGEEWYEPYASYLQSLVEQDTTGRYDKLDDALWFVLDTPYSACDRYDFVWLLASVLPEGSLKAINSITKLPDEAQDEDVLAFYNAGILTGTNAYGTFCGLDHLNRGQAAAMLARIVDPSQRVHFTPKALVASQEVLGLDPDAAVLTIDGFSVSGDLYTYVLLSNVVVYQIEAYSALYSKYADYLQGYWDSIEEYDDFSDFLQKVHGIDAEKEIAVDWNAPDKAGMTPAQKVRSDTLDALKQMAVLFNHASEYPLSADQKSLLEAELPDLLVTYYGFSDAFVRQLASQEMLMENMGKKYAPSSGEMSSYLTSSGYFYGRCIQVGYDLDDTGWYGRSKSEALSLIQTVRQQAVSHSGEEDYFAYLGWKYGDNYEYGEPPLIDIGMLADTDRKTLSSLRVGGLSGIIDVAEDASYGYYSLYLRDDPSQDEELLGQIGQIPAAAQLSTWAASAKVTTTAAYDTVNVAAAADAYDRIALLLS